MKTNRTCSVCGATLNEENAHEFNGQALCTDCFNDNTVVCCHCGRRIWWDYGTPYSYTVGGQSDGAKDYAKDYLETLKQMAMYEGYSPGLIDDLLAEGFSLDEIEMYLYDYETA